MLAFFMVAQSKEVVVSLYQLLDELKLFFLSDSAD